MSKSISLTITPLNTVLNFPVIIHFNGYRLDHFNFDPDIVLDFQKYERL